MSKSMFVACVLAATTACKKKENTGEQGAPGSGSAIGTGAPGTNDAGGGAVQGGTGAAQSGCVAKLGGDAELPSGPIVLKEACGVVAVEGEVTIDADVTIEPGVTLAFAENAGLWVGWSQPAVLTAKGTGAKPITFTSAITKTPGVWQGLYLGGQSSRSVLEHVVIEYAGSKGDDEGYSLQVHGKDTVLRQSAVRNGRGVGVLAPLGRTFQLIETNTFESPGRAAMRLHPANLPALRVNTYSGDGAVVELESAALDESATLHAGPVYRLLGDLGVARGEKSSTPVLTIDAGVTVQAVSGAELSVGYTSRGTLKAMGTAAKPIRLAGVDAGKGAWKGLVLYAEAREVMLQQVVVSGAESTDERGAVHAERGAEATLNSVTFEHVEGVGLSVADGAKITAKGLTAPGAKAPEWREKSE